MFNAYLPQLEPLYCGNISLISSPSILTIEAPVSFFIPSTNLLEYSVFPVPGDPAIKYDSGLIDDFTSFVNLLNRAIVIINYFTFFKSILYIPSKKSPPA